MHVSRGGASQPPTAFNRGQRVHARWSIDHRWYLATITRRDLTTGTATFTVIFDDDGAVNQNVSPEDLRRVPRADSPPQGAPPFEMNQRVRARFKGGPTWYDGRVKHVERSCNGWLFSVAYDDGDFEVGVPEYRMQEVRPNVRLQLQGAWFVAGGPQLLESPEALNPELADLRPGYAHADSTASHASSASSERSNTTSAAAVQFHCGDFKAGSAGVKKQPRVNRSNAEVPQVADGQLLTGETSSSQGDSGAAAAVGSVELLPATPRPSSPPFPCLVPPEDLDVSQTQSSRVPPSPIQPARSHRARGFPP